MEGISGLHFVLTCAVLLCHGGLAKLRSHPPWGYAQNILGRGVWPEGHRKEVLEWELKKRHLQYQGELKVEGLSPSRSGRPELQQKARSVLDSMSVAPDDRGVRSRAKPWRTGSSNLLEPETAGGPGGKEEGVQITWAPSRIAMEMEDGQFEGRDRARGRWHRQRRRHHRSVGGEEDPEDCKGDDRCCRRSRRVSFKDIGWADWVVAPEAYTIYYCDGACPHNYRPASMHTQIKARLHHMTNGAMPRPCCVPAAYEPMVLLHHNSQGKLTLTSYNGMIVSKCHCA